MLATRKQQPTETLDEYLQQLKTLAKDCSFKAVTADIYKQEMIRDSYINGLLSNAIRQRLLENTTLTLEQAHTQARSLDQADRNASMYSQGNQLVACAADSESDNAPTLAAQHKKVCYFCGGNRHPRSQCPARDKECSFCAKKGHFAAVCMSKAQPKHSTKDSVSASMYQPHLCTTICAAHPLCLSAAVTTINVCNQPIAALIDSGSSENFITERLCTLNNVSITQSNKKIQMAEPSLSANIIGTCSLSIIVNGRSYDAIAFNGAI